MAFSPSQANIDTSPAWRCSHNNRLHRHDSTYTADTPPSDLIPDTPGRLRRCQQKNGIVLGSSQASQPTPTKSALKPQQSSGSNRAARMECSLPAGVVLDSSSNASPGPRVYTADDEDVPLPPASPYLATTDRELSLPGQDLSSQEEPAVHMPSSPAPYLPSSPPLLNPRYLKPTVADSPESPLQPLRSRFQGLLERLSRSPSPAPAPAPAPPLCSNPPLYDPASPPVVAPTPSPSLAAQRQANGILLTRLSDQEAQLARLQIRNKTLAAKNRAQATQLQLMTGQREEACSKVEVERARRHVLVAGWVTMFIGCGIYLCWRWVTGVEFEYVERRRRDGYGM